MKFNEQAVDQDTVKAAERLAPVIAKDFYLAGGTSIALQFGHRISLDLDLFSEKNKLLEANRSKIIQKLSSGKLEVLENVDGTCHLKVGKTSVSLFRYDAYPLLHPASLTWRGIPIADIRDVAAMKLSAIASRGAKKDFIDLYVITKKIGLNEVIRAGIEKFPNHTTFILQACKALVYFNDADQDPKLRMLSNIEWSDVKRYFLKEIPRFLKKELLSNPRQ